MTLGKYFLSLAGRGSIFLQEVVEMLEEVVASRQEVRWIWRMRQNFVAQFIQLLKQWLCDVCGEELGPSCWPMAAAGGAFSVHLINLLSIFLRCNGFARIQKAVVNQISSRPQNSDCDLFWCKFGFGKCFGASPQSNYWASHLWFSNKIHFPLHITIWSRNCLLSLHRIKEDNTSKWLFFWFSVRSRGTHLLSFFTFPICFKHQKTVEWSVLSSSAISPVVLRGSVSMILSIGYCQLTMAGHCAPHLQGSCLLFNTFWTTTALCIWFVSNSWAKMHWWCCKLSLLLYTQFELK